MTHDGQRTERSIKNKDTSKDTSLRGITMAALLQCWNNKEKDFVFAPIVMPSQTLPTQPAVEQEPKPVQPVSGIALAASRSFARAKAITKLKEEEKEREKEANNAETIRRQNLSVEDREEEDADAKLEVLVQHMWHDANDASLRRRNAHAHDTEPHVSGHPPAHLRYSTSIPYNASASTSDRDKSKMDTMRPSGQTHSPETPLEASIIID
jgi:hypothetical protein